MNKPFNLEAALSGAPVVNGHGEEVLQITRFLTTNDPYCLVGVKVDKYDDHKTIETFTVDGVFSLANPDGGLSNLQMAELKPEKKGEGIINVWQNTDGFSPAYANVHPTKESADAERTVSCSGKPKTLLAQVPFEY